MTWLIAMLAGSVSVAESPAVVRPMAGARVAPAVAGPVLESAARARPARRKGSQRLSALALPGDGSDAPPTPFSFSAMEDERQRLRLGVKPGLRRARFGIDYRVALDR